jgi:predicted dehydrogenase
VKKLKGAIIGFGRVAGEAHVPGFQSAPGFEIAAVIEPSEPERARARGVLPGARTYEDFAAALAAEDELDFVDVATPPRAHAPIVIEALHRGLHVLCEKPLALDLPEIRAIRSAVRRSGNTVFTVHNWKYAPLFRRLHGLLRAGAVGEIRAIDWQVLRPNPPQGASEPGWRLDRSQAGGGILVDHGWHAFYLMQFLTGREPRSIAARVGAELGFAVEDRAECEIDFGGPQARIELRWGAAERRTAGTVHGSLGDIEIGDDRLVITAATRARDEIRFSPPLSASSYHPEWFPTLLEGFRDEIQHPEKRGRNLAEAVRVAELIAAAYRSDGRSVPLVEATEPGQEDR